MSTEAVGAYFLRLREHARINRLSLAKRVGTSDAQLIRIENGSQETRGSLVAALIHALEANAEDVVALYLDAAATADEGRLKADSWIERRANRSPAGAREAIRREVDNLVDQLTDYELGKWVALGERIVSERNKTR